ncbi:hypothetical protein KAR91_70285 [Candidatus Pacearchaeota archaeon]|nr:hypothetical protein [Candidatus Pacearchaeota archaeon]
MAREKQTLIVKDIEDTCKVELIKDSWAGLPRKNITYAKVFSVEKIEKDDQFQDDEKDGKEQEVVVFYEENKDYELDKKAGVIQPTKRGRIKSGKTVNVELIYDLEVNIQEMKMSEIRAIIDNLDASSLMTTLDNRLLSCTNLKMDDLLNLTPSEGKQISDVFCQVNQVLLDTLKKMKIKEILLNAVLQDFQARAGLAAVKA